MKEFDRYDVISLGMIFLLSLLKAVQFFSLPQFVDGYYHISAANAFIHSGGWVGWDWWSFAPQGRPHLYPPLYHLILVFLTKAGLSGLNALRSTEVAVCPLFFGVFWFVCKKLNGPRFAFWALAALSSFFPFFSSVSSNVAASLAMVLGFLSWLFLYKDRWISAGICLALAFYAHTALAAVFLFSFLAVMIFDVSLRRAASKIIFLGLFLAGPFLLHQLRYLSYLNITVLKEAGFIQFSLLLIPAGLWAVFSARPNKPLVILFWGMLAGSVIVFIKYPYRIFSSQGMVAVALLAAFGFDKFLAAAAPAKVKAISLGAAVMFLVFHPVLGFQDDQPRLDLVDSTYFDLVSAKDKQMFEFQSFLHPKFYDPIVAVIKANTGPQDIISSNVGIAGQIFSALTDRPSANSMLSEVVGKDTDIHLGYAKVIVWMKLAIAQQDKVLAQMDLSKVYENDVAAVFINRNYTPSSKVIPAKLGFGLIVFIVSAFILAVFWDNFKLA